MLGKLNLIGCGTVGKTLGALWNAEGTFTIQDVCNQSKASASSAVEFIGAGRVVDSLQSVAEADVIAITATDDAIFDIATKLGSVSTLNSSTVVFHCSGALSSDILRALRSRGVKVASAHPVKSFSDLDWARRTFKGTKIALEGDGEAVNILSKAFEAIGGVVFRIDPQVKGFYHTGLVLACNYLTALMECAVDTCGKAGLDRSDALELMQPLVRETMDAIFTRGTEGALTGPVARGDVQLVAKQIELLKGWKGEYADLYSGLAKIAFDIAKRKKKS
jgi:predicted short-subunit dehydrogenase-like oxidoreductase (DUF2520 family)